MVGVLTNLSFDVIVMWAEETTDIFRRELGLVVIYTTTKKRRKCTGVYFSKGVPIYPNCSWWLWEEKWSLLKSVRNVIHFNMGYIYFESDYPVNIIWGHQSIRQWQINCLYRFSCLTDRRTGQLSLVLCLSISSIYIPLSSANFSI